MRGLSWLRTLRGIDPLFQFIAIGLALYVLIRMLAPSDDTGATIRVDSDTLAEYYLASGDSEAGASTRNVAFADLPPVQKRALLARYVEEQALYREAKAWGLDSGDVAIRRRMGQSLKYALEPDGVAQPSEAQLNAHFARHRDRYAAAAQTSFDHIYFSPDLRGSGGARSAAARALPGGHGDWLAEGDRFAYQRSYRATGTGLVASHLGEAFARALAGVPADGSWHGPIESTLGWHLVRVTSRSRAHAPPFADVRDAVRDDWQRETRQRTRDATVAQIVAGYRTDIAPALQRTLR